MFNIICYLSYPMLLLFTMSCWKQSVLCPVSCVLWPMSCILCPVPYVLMKTSIPLLSCVLCPVSYPMSSPVQSCGKQVVLSPLCRSSLLSPQTSVVLGPGPRKVAGGAGHLTVQGWMINVIKWFIISYSV